MNDLYFSINEAVNGWIVHLPFPAKPEFVETKREALDRLESYLNKAQIHELNLVIEGAGKVC